MRHAQEWLIRLGDGTEESHRRAQAAVDELWPYTGELLAYDDSDKTMTALAIIPRADVMEALWNATIVMTLLKAKLERPDDGWMQSGGRTGRHTEHLGYLLAEMQFLQRTYPGATW